MIAYTDILSFQQRLFSGREWVLGERELRIRMIEANEHHSGALLAHSQQLEYAMILVALCLAFIILSFILKRSTLQANVFRAVALISVAAVCLVNGVSMPMLEIGAYNENLVIPIVVQLPLVPGGLDLSKQFSGHMYYYYENKSIAQLIQTLFVQSNYLVGFAVMLFSIIVPITKLTLSLLMLASRRVRASVNVSFIVVNIGKWSMADVFVVAAFLSYLSFNQMNTGIETEVNTLLGMYFFLGYCLISMISTVIIKQSLIFTNTNTS